jgi:hypothetical protein
MKKKQIRLENILSKLIKKGYKSKALNILEYALYTVVNVLKCESFILQYQVHFFFKSFYAKVIQNITKNFTNMLIKTAVNFNLKAWSFLPLTSITNKITETHTGHIRRDRPQIGNILAYFLLEEDFFFKKMHYSKLNYFFFTLNKKKMAVNDRTIIKMRAEKKNLSILEKVKIYDLVKKKQNLLKVNLYESKLIVSTINNFFDTKINNSKVLERMTIRSLSADYTENLLTCKNKLKINFKIQNTH